MKYKREEGRQCTYNVTLRRVHVTVVAMEKQSVLHILCVCVWPWPARKGPAPCFVVVCGLFGCTIFSTQYLINGRIFGKKGYGT